MANIVRKEAQDTVMGLFTPCKRLSESEKDQTNTKRLANKRQISKENFRFRFSFCSM